MKLHTTLVIEHDLDGRTDRNVTGNVAKVFDGDAVEQAEQLAALQQVFSAEFDRGELTVDNLRPVLWAAHWLKAIRPVAQRASELLTLASTRTFEPGSKAARDSDAVSRVMASVATTEPHCLTALEVARKFRVPSDFYSTGADGLPPLCEADPLALARHHQATGTDQHPGAAEHLVGWNFSGPVLDFTRKHPKPVDPLTAHAHEMHELLKLINVKVAGLNAVNEHGLEPSPRMRAEADSALEAVWMLLDKIAGRGPLEPDEECWKATDDMVAEAADYQAGRDRAEAITELADDQLALVGRIESQRRGLMALANYLGPTCSAQVLSAMERGA